VSVDTVKICCLDSVHHGLCSLSLNLLSIFFVLNKSAPV
jgi:hypothetical protein